MEHRLSATTWRRNLRHSVSTKNKWTLKLEHQPVIAGRLRLYDLAQRYAASIRKPDYNDTEHGLPALLVLCQLESKKV